MTTATNLWATKWQSAAKQAQTNVRAALLDVVAVMADEGQSDEVREIFEQLGADLYEARRRVHAALVALGLEDPETRV